MNRNSVNKLGCFRLRLRFQFLSSQGRQLSHHQIKCTPPSDNIFYHYQVTTNCGKWHCDLQSSTKTLLNIFRVSQKPGQDFLAEITYFHWYKTLRMYSVGWVVEDKMLPLDNLTGLTSIIVHWPGPVQLPASHWPKLMCGYLRQISAKSVNNHPNLDLPLTTSTITDFTSNSTKPLRL